MLKRLEYLLDECLALVFFAAFTLLVLCALWTGEMWWLTRRFLAETG